MIWFLLACASEAVDTGADGGEATPLSLAGSWRVQEETGSLPAVPWDSEVVFDEGAVWVDGVDVATWTEGEVLEAEEGWTLRLQEIGGETWEARGVGEPGWATWEIDASERILLYPY